MGKCTGLCSTGPVPAGVQSPQWAHEQNVSPCSAAKLLKILVLYVTVHGYLQGKDPLRVSDKSRGYTQSQAYSLSQISKICKERDVI